MKSALAPTGTTSLLERLSPLIPDEFINDLLSPERHPGRQNFMSAAQLWRVHLLAFLTPAHSFNAVVRLLPEQRSWRVFAHLHHRHRTPDVHMLNEFRRRVGVGGLRRINEELLRPLLDLVATNAYSVAMIDATDLPAATVDQKKEGTRHWSAHRASLGARSLKPGHTRFFVGYKKHTLRLWMRAYQPTVLLAPLISWAAPAHVPEGYLLKPSLHYCQQRLHWRPAIVTGDLGYIHQPTKKEIRERWQVAVVTRLKSDMNIVEPFDDWNQMSCSQGQSLRWLGYEAPQQSHWFGVPPGPSLCSECWEASRCDREFVYPAALHESLLGLLPLNTVVASRLLKQVRSWIEPTQAFEKNVLGVGQVFLNSLRLAWIVSLLADAVALLRARALLTTGPPHPLLQRLLPKQLALALRDLDQS